MQDKQSSYNSAAARAEYTKILDRVAVGERVILTKYNIPVAGMVPIADIKRLTSEKQQSGNQKKSA